MKVIKDKKSASIPVGKLKFGEVFRRLNDSSEAHVYMRSCLDNNTIGIDLVTGIPEKFDDDYIVMAVNAELHILGDLPKFD